MTNIAAAFDKQPMYQFGKVDVESVKESSKKNLNGLHIEKHLAIDSKKAEKVLDFLAWISIKFYNLIVSLLRRIFGIRDKAAPKAAEKDKGVATAKIVAAPTAAAAPALGFTDRAEGVDLNIDATIIPRPSQSLPSPLYLLEEPEARAEKAQKTFLLACSEAVSDPDVIKNAVDANPEDIAKLIASKATQEIMPGDFKKLEKELVEKVAAGIDDGAMPLELLLETASTILAALPRDICSSLGLDGEQTRNARKVLAENDELVRSYLAHRVAIGAAESVLDLAPGQEQLETDVNPNSDLPFHGKSDRNNSPGQDGSSDAAFGKRQRQGE